MMVGLRSDALGTDLCGCRSSAQHAGVCHVLGLRLLLEPLVYGWVGMGRQMGHVGTKRRVHVTQPSFWPGSLLGDVLNHAWVFTLHAQVMGVQGWGSGGCCSLLSWQNSHTRTQASQGRAGHRGLWN